MPGKSALFEIGHHRNARRLRNEGGANHPRHAEPVNKEHARRADDGRRRPVGARAHPGARVKKDIARAGATVNYYYGMDGADALAAGQVNEAHALLAQLGCTKYENSSRPKIPA